MATEFHRALVLVATILSAFPATLISADLHDQLSAAQKAEDEFAQIEVLRRLIDASPDDAHLHALLTELWLEVGDPAMAIATLDAWPGKPPASLEARTRATVAAHQDGTTAAISILTAYLADHPDDTTALRQLADLQPPTDRIPTLTRLIAIQKTPADLSSRADANFQTGEFTAAIGDARAAAALDPQNAASFLPRYDRLAAALGNITKLTTKIDTLEPNRKSKIENPKSLTPLLLRGYYLDSVHLYQESLADAQAALALAPVSVYARILSARALVGLDEFEADAALDEFSVNTSLAATGPHSAAALIDADVQALSHPDDANRLAKLAVELGGENAQSLLVIEYADRALALDQKAFDAATAAITATVALGDLPTAVGRLRKLEVAEPPPRAVSDATAAIADAYFQRSNVPLALIFADRSLAAEPTEFMIQLKAGCLQRLGRAAEAQALLDQ